MSGLVTIYGGSGFVGRYIVRRLAKLGWRIRVVCRRPNEALFVKPYGAVGQIEVAFCNIRDEVSVRSAMRGADAVVNCVGILVAEGRNGFDAVQADGAARVARIASETGVKTFVQLSSLAADPNAKSQYGRSKAAGDAAVLAAFPGAMILRPSVIFGYEDVFFNRFASMAVRSPVLPLTGADAKFQPVYVDDVAKAAVAGVLGKAKGVYELGGPDVETLHQMMARMLDLIGRDRKIVTLPRWLAAIVAWVGDCVQTLTFGLVTNRMLTRDQLRSLQSDVICASGAKGFADLGITPVAMGAVLPDYLWRFRKAGQFDAIKASAKNLRKTS